MYIIEFASNYHKFSNNCILADNIEKDWNDIFSKRNCKCFKHRYFYLYLYYLLPKYFKYFFL